MISGRLTNCPLHSQTILELRNNNNINQTGNTMNLKSAFPTVFKLIAKFNKPRISEQELTAINAARQSLNIYYANLHKDRDHHLARRTWLKLNNIQVVLHSLLDESPAPDTLYALGVELQSAKGTLRSDYDF
jgi:hypothetical protein